MGFIKMRFLFFGINANKARKVHKISKVRRITTLMCLITLMTAGCTLDAVPPSFGSGLVSVRGMRLDSVTCIGGVAKIVTTGAEIRIDPATRMIFIDQRIGAERRLATLEVSDPDWWARVGDVEKPSRTTFDITWGSERNPVLVVSGDSVIRLFGARCAAVAFAFEPAYTYVYKANSGILALDGQGGLAVVPPKIGAAPWRTKVANRVWRIDSEEPIPVLFVGICPPREFDWARAKLGVVHYSSHVVRYPSDGQIAGYSKFSKVLEMHSWVWRRRADPAGVDDEGRRPPPPWWDLSWRAPEGRWIPENEAELKRTVETAHRFKMKVLPYVNCDTTEISLALQKPEHCITELRRLKELYGFDGFYLDGLYLNDPESSYMLIRAIRDLVGEEGWITYHDTQTGFPFLDAYADLIITGEHSNFDRWASTSYNISNAAASMWPEILLDIADGRPFLKILVDQSLSHNNRVIFMTGEAGQWRGWRLYFTDEEMDFMKEYYIGKIEKLKN